VLAEAFSAVAGETLSINGAALALDERGRASFTPPASGLYRLLATATDLDGYTTTFEKFLKVRDPADTAAPVVGLDPVLAGQALEAPTAIRGQIVDSNLESWRLEIARAGSDAFVLLNEGTTPVEGVLATLAPGAFEAGPYRLRLTATDIAGRSGETETNVELAAAADASRYVRTETDFVASLAGHDLAFTRRYDSHAADLQGSFGSGWRLAWRDLDLVTDLAGAGPLTEGTRAYLTLPTGERAGFTFAPQAVHEAGIVWYRPHWIADDPAAGWELDSADLKLMRAGDRFYWLSDSRPYNPAAITPDGAQYTLTAPDGTRYEINAARGVSAIVYGDGVRLSVTDSGVYAATGESIRFVLDDGGRIGAAVAPDGRAYTYEYDGSELVSARDLSDAASERFAYDAQHRLVLTTGAAIEYGASATEFALAGDLGAALHYLSASKDGTLQAGGTDRDSF